MQTINQTIRLHRIQAAFRRSNALYRGFVGGRGSGKSWVGAYDMIRRARPGRTYLIGSPTGVLLGDTTFPTFRAIAQQLGVWNQSLVRIAPYPTVELTNGAVIRFRTAENPEKMRGPNLSGVWLDEASLMDRDAFDVCIASLREHGEQGWLSATFTPKGLTHWTYELWGRNRPNTEIFHAQTRDNPFVPKGFHQQLAQQYTGLRAKQELEGAFIAIEGAEWPPEYFGEWLWFDDWPEPMLTTVLALDPAQGKGEKGKGCYASFVRLGVDRQATLWVDAWLSQTWDAAQLVEMGFSLCEQLRPAAFSVEINGGQEFLAAMFLQEMKRRNVVLPLYVLTSTEDKEVRIRRIGPYLAQRKLKLKRGPKQGGTDLLATQLMEFPVGPYKDGPDALEMAERLAKYMLGQRPAGSTPKLYQG